ncbi:hypothetical protein [Pectobacterium polaris]|nr:hypothetical protein [Pectobacterium polaris]
MKKSHKNKKAGVAITQHPPVYCHSLFNNNPAYSTMIQPERGNLPILL